MNKIILTFLLNKLNKILNKARKSLNKLDYLLIKFYFIY